MPDFSMTLSDSEAPRSLRDENRPGLRAASPAQDPGAISSEPQFVGLKMGTLFLDSDGESAPPRLHVGHTTRRGEHAARRTESSSGLANASPAGEQDSGGPPCPRERGPRGRWRWGA